MPGIDPLARPRAIIWRDPAHHMYIFCPTGLRGSFPPPSGVRPSYGCERRARAVSLWVCRAVRSACKRAHGNPVTARYLLLGHRVAQQVVWVLRTSATHAGAAHVWRHNSCTRCCASRRLESASTGAHSLTTADILPSARTSVSVPGRQARS